MSSDEAFVVAVLEALKNVGLEAIVVGNVAAILQGAPVTTQDIDLLVRDTIANRRKIAAFGRALGARPRRVSSLTESLRIDASAGTVDVIFDRIPGPLSFQALRSRAIHLELAGIEAVVARLDDVIASKEAADRPKDRAQLAALRDALRVKKAFEATAKPKRR
jgi:predicted nucleotidyltransferase